jgi:NADH-ubiquinone oxidoreductase chain 4
MLFLSIPLTPLIGVLFITLTKDISLTLKVKKLIALGVSILTFILSLLAFIMFDFSTNNFQFVVEYHKISYFDFYLGVDGLSMYFVLLTTIIIPGSLLSN